MIDIHTHVFSPFARDQREALAAADPRFAAIYANPNARMQQVEALLRMMDKQDVETSVVCGFPWLEMENCRRENDYLLQCGHRYPDRILPFISLPKDVAQSIAELARCLASGVSGVGELAPGTYEDQLWDQQAIEAVFSAIRDSGLPLLLHTNEPVGRSYAGKGSVGLQQIQQLIEAAQGIPLIMAHMGGGFFVYELLPEIAALCQHVYYDTAAAPLLYDPRVYKVALSVIGPDRMILGSDWPLLSPERTVQAVRDAGLSEADIERVTIINAKRLLGLGGGS